MNTESTEFIFIRHAESTANVSSLDPSKQVADPVLTERGNQQAAELIEWIGHLNVRAIYTSDTIRARATAKPIAEMFGLRGIELPEIDEWNIGKGGKVNEQKLQEMFDRWCSGDWNANLEGAPQSETLNELVARVVPAFRSIFDQHQKQDGVIIVVAHGGAISWTIPAFTESIDLSYTVQNYLDNCGSVSLVSRKSSPHVVRWASETF